MADESLLLELDCLCRDVELQSSRIKWSKTAEGSCHQRQSFLPVFSFFSIYYLFWLNTWSLMASVKRHIGVLHIVYIDIQVLYSNRLTRTRTRYALIHLNFTHVKFILLQCA